MEKGRPAGVGVVDLAGPKSLSRKPAIQRVDPSSADTRTDFVRQLYPASLWLCLIICICHVLSLTLVIYFDGQWYVQLAHMLGTNRFPGQWDFLRTPLFPAMLKIMFGLVGPQALAVIGLQTGLACAAIWLLGRRLRRMDRPVQAAIGMVVLCAYPTLIAYEHALLTEIGSFFFLTLLVYVLTERDPITLRGSVMAALVISAGYYLRASLLYLAPLAGVICAVSIVRAAGKEHGAIGRQCLRLAASELLIVTVLPFILAYPWQRNPAVSVRSGQSCLLFGLVKQSVLPLDDPILGAAAPAYRLAINQSTSNGVFPYSGLQNGSEWSVIGPIYHHGSSAGSIFLRVVRTHPKRYLAGLWRNLVLYSGFGGFDNDNACLRNQVFIASGNKIDPGPGWFPPLGAEFVRNTAPSFTSRILLAVSPLYDRLVLFGFIATVIACVLAVWRLDAVMLTFTSLPLAFLLMHAIILMSQDRMALPAHPLLLLNLILLPTWLKRGTRRTHRAEGLAHGDIAVPLNAGVADYPRRRSCGL